MKKKSLLMTAVATLGLTATTIAQNIPYYLPSDGLVSWWPFNGNANDESGNGNDGAVNGASLIQDRFGIQNSAFSLNGTSDFIQTNLIGPIGNSSRSVSYWMNSSSNQQYMTVLGYGDNNLDTKDFHIWHNWSCNGVNMNISNVAITYTTDSLDNNWHHFVFVFDSLLSSSITNVKIYKNGELLTNTCSLYGSGNLNTGNNYPISIGKYHAVNNHYFNGKLDDIGIWNRALTQQEISDLYNGNICYQTITVTDTLLINMGITGFNPVTYNNTIKIFPNPANNHITIDYGNFATMNGYQLKIENSLGQQLFQTNITQQTDYLSLNNWGGNGLYFVHIIDAQGNTIDIRKIVLQ